MQLNKPTSSITIMWTLSALAKPFFIRSSSLPGVAITTCTKRVKEIKKNIGVYLNTYSSPQTHVENANEN